METKLESNMRITYAIFATPQGKGYGCFAIRHNKGEKKYIVAASFCHPSDRKVFSKKEARMKALSRLNSKQWVVELESENHNFAEIIKLAMESSSKTPSWASKTLKNKHYFHTLAEDRFTSQALINTK